MKKLLFGLLLVGISIDVVAQGGKGNGGDSCEKRILSIKEDLKQWILSGGADYLVLPTSITHSEYNEKMLSAIEEATVSCKVKIDLIGGSEKTCINYTDSNKEKRMDCNFKRFILTESSKQYELIHHEYAGIAGFEVNKGSKQSRYFATNQISAFLEYVTIKKLAVKPLSENNDDLDCIKIKEVRIMKRRGFFDFHNYNSSDFVMVSKPQDGRNEFHYYSADMLEEIRENVLKLALVVKETNRSSLCIKYASESDIIEEVFIAYSYLTGHLFLN